MLIADKIVFITGGGGGIGGGMAQAFAEKGARIVLADICFDHAQEQAALLPRGALVDVVSLDVTSLDNWTRARSQVEERFGAVDVLCNNAGVSAAFGPLIDIPPAEFERVMAVNVAGVFNGVKTFVRGMAETGSGHLVNTSSINGLCPQGGAALYSASKFAVAGLSDALRQELAPVGVGVSTLFPGLTRSRMAEIAMERLTEGDPSRAARMRARMMEPIWLGRAVVQAVENNQPYIASHPEFRANLALRTEEILAAFGQPAQPGYGA
jgi:NAD(P)-dependent dehydrogenase (short-subunit alcohol dehydrogenase family)